MCGESPQGMFSTFSLLPAREQFLSGCGPHFSFVLAKEKWRPQRWKRKPLRDELTDGAANSPKTGTGRHELPTELETPLPAALYLNLKSVRRRICGHGAQRGANRTPSASLSAAAPAHLQSRVVRSEAERTGLLQKAFQVCSPVNALLPNVGKHSALCGLSAQPAEDF